MTDPERRDQLAQDLDHLADELAEHVAEALVLGVPVRRDVYSATASLTAWARDLRHARR
jgi:hypothetical protein